MKPSSRPEGTYAVITKHGELYEIKKTGGIYFCMPWVTFTITDILINIDLNPVSCHLVACCIWIDCQILPNFW